MYHGVTDGQTAKWPSAIHDQIKSNLLMQKGQLATDNANIKTV